MDQKKQIVTETVAVEQVLTAGQVTEIVKHLVISGALDEEVERYRNERLEAASCSMSYKEEAEELAKVDEHVVARLLLAFGVTYPERPALGDFFNKEEK